MLLVTNGTGVKKYYSNMLNSNIEIPKYSFFIDETAGDDTYQLEFVMFGKEEHITEQLYKVFDNNENNNNVNEYRFSQWSVNDEKTYKLVVIVYEK